MDLVVFWVVWMIAATATKRAVQQQTYGSRFAQFSNSANDARNTDREPAPSSHSFYSDTHHRPTGGPGRSFYEGAKRVCLDGKS